MGRPLNGKKDIMKYTGMGEAMLDAAVQGGGFPHFWIGQKMCSHTDSVDRWFIEASYQRVRIGRAGDGDEDEDGSAGGPCCRVREDAPAEDGEEERD